MPVKDNEVVSLKLDKIDINDCIENAKRILDVIVDRRDLHDRDELERFQDLLMGEVAEKLVIKWLNQNDKHAVSAVNKNSLTPDFGHDIWVRDTKGTERKCSVKSSISVYKSTPADILDNFTLATTQNEIRDINIQVYFWLETKATPRISVPSIKNSAIISWASKKEIEGEIFNQYSGEKRKSPAVKLRQLHPMHELLKHLI